MPKSVGLFYVFQIRRVFGTMLQPLKFQYMVVCYLTYCNESLLASYCSILMIVERLPLYNDNNNENSTHGIQLGLHHILNIFNGWWLHPQKLKFFSRSACFEGPVGHYCLNKIFKFKFEEVKQRCSPNLRISSCLQR